MLRRRRHIVIVGGGFSGVALAVHLMRRSAAAVRITLIEAGERVGRGLAYGTLVESHLLNAAADQMSLYQDDATHFLRWAQCAGHATAATEFVPRLHYGSYLEDALRSASRVPDARIEVLLQSRVADVMRGLSGWIVQLEDGRRIASDDIVLATGNPAPADPLSVWLPAGTPRYVRDPWQPDALSKVEPDDKVLLIGTGLTMIDMLLTLRQRDHRGFVHALSRRGLLPMAHPPVRETLPDELRLPFLAALDGLDLRGLLQAVRHTMAAAVAQGLGPQTVIDAMRPVVSRLWAAVTAADRGRFLRWLRPYWDAIRHRAAPQVATVVQALRAEGRFFVDAGRLTGAEAFAAGIAIRRRVRGEVAEIEAHYDWVVNCTGPAFARDGDTALERVLVARGLVAPDALGLGRRTEDDGAALDADGFATGLYMLGPACRARHWELTAVPELRRAAERLASGLVQAAITSNSPSCPDLQHSLHGAVHSRQLTA